MMSNARFYEDDDPPQPEDDWSPVPDVLRGWAEAGPCFGAILKDAIARAAGHPESLDGFLNRYYDIRLHTQYRQTYADPLEKRRIRGPPTGFSTEP